MLRLSILAPLLFAGAAQALPAVSTLAAQRQATLRAVGQQFNALPTLCRDNGGEWQTDIIAFPSGRADRIYVFSMGGASAYRLEKGVLRLVWCGSVVSNQNPEGVSNVEKALHFPLKTITGRTPTEGSLDIFYGLSGSVTTQKMNAGGKVICTKRRFDEAEFRSAFQFDARDT